MDGLNGMVYGGVWKGSIYLLAGRQKGLRKCRSETIK